MGNGGISPYSGGSGSGGSGGAGGPSGSGGRSPLEAMYTIIAVAIVLVFALIVELWKFPWQVWAFFAGIGILGYLCMRFWPHVVKTAQGRAFIYTVLVEGRLVRVLRLGGVYQSATNLGLHWAEPVFAYHRAFDAVFEADRELAARTGHGVRRVLALGGGGFAWPKHALLARPDLIMGVVEIDPKVIECAEGWFYVERLKKIAGKRLHIIEGDGRAYLEERAERIAQAERVLPGEIPGELPSAEGSSVEEPSAVSSVGSNGAPSAIESSKERKPRPRAHRFDAIVQDLTFLRDEVATLKQVFTYVYVLPVDEPVWAGEDNYIVLATDGMAFFDGTIPYDDDFLGTPLCDADGVAVSG